MRSKGAGGLQAWPTTIYCGLRGPAACLDSEGDENEDECSADASDKDGDCAKKAKPKSKLAKFSEPSYSVEWSRVLCRTGHRGPYIHVCIQHFCSGSPLSAICTNVFYTALL